MALTQKQELFCCSYLETGNASEAYRRAYEVERMKPETVNRSAKELMDNPNIAARLEELRAPIVEKAGVTLAGHLEMLAHLRDEARTEGQLSAAINAEIARGKASGLYIDRKELAGPEGGPISLQASRPDLSKFTDEELEQYAELCEKAMSGDAHEG